MKKNEKNLEKRKVRSHNIIKCVKVRAFCTCGTTE